MLIEAIILCKLCVFYLLIKSGIRIELRLQGETMNREGSLKYMDFMRNVIKNLAQKKYGNN